MKFRVQATLPLPADVYFLERDSAAFRALLARVSFASSTKKERGRGREGVEEGPRFEVSLSKRKIKGETVRGSSFEENGRGGKLFQNKNSLCG